MVATSETETFNRPDRVVEGWYWVVRSAELRAGGVAAANVAGRELVVWRGVDGVAHVMDAYCPHMGAHLAEGRVDAGGLRCFFHDWTFDGSGACVRIPCQDKPVDAKVRTWPTTERYGLVWVWTGAEPRHPIPYAPELADDPCDSLVAASFEKACHPNVVMINAIDAQHFNSVHHLPARLEMERRDLSRHASTFSNTVPPSEHTWFGRFLRRLYAGPITYSMCYWSGSNGTVTLGPDRWHFHILFALRLGKGGKTEGQTLLLTKHRPGLLGQVVSRVALELTRVVGNYFAQGDTRVFQTIKFDFRTPIKADQAIIGFIRHLEAQPAVEFGSWAPVPGKLTLAEPRAAGADARTQA